eukprot:scaffold1223_cov119-Cylindrotheca_fusiformis.AAC.26
MPMIVADKIKEMDSPSSCLSREAKRCSLNEDGTGRKDENTMSSMSSFMSGLLAEQKLKFGTPRIRIVDDNARLEHDRKAMCLVKVRRTNSSVGLSRWGGECVEGGARKPTTSIVGPDSPPVSPVEGVMRRSAASDTMLLRMPMRRESPRIIKPLYPHDWNDSWNDSANERWQTHDNDAPAMVGSSSNSLLRKSSSSAGMRKSSSVSALQKNPNSGGLRSSSGKSGKKKSSTRKKTSKGLKDRASMLGLNLK